MRPRQARRNILWLVDLIDSSLGPNTNVYLWEATAPNPALQGVWANTTTDVCISGLNSAGKEGALPLVQRTLAAGRKPGGAAGTGVACMGNASSGDGPKWYATYGLFAPTYERRELSHDGVHYPQDWYNHVAAMMLGGVCGNA